MIYLISTDSHKDSINLEYYFTNEGQIESWIKNYREYYFNESVRNVKVNFEDLKVTFEYDEFYSWGEWDKATYYLFKLNQYENS